MSKKEKDHGQLSDEVMLRKMRLASEMTPDELKEYFPSLHAEIIGNRPNLTLSSRDIKQLLTETQKSTNNISKEISNNDLQSVEEPQVQVPDPLKGFDPGVIDFIRRARTDEEAIEIIDYMRKQGEISEEKAKSLLNQLKIEGLRSFGSYKEDGYYFHYAEEKKMEMRRQIIEERKKRQHEKQP